MRPVVQRVLWVALGVGIGAAAMATVWWNWPRAAPDRAAIEEPPSTAAPQVRGGTSRPAGEYFGFPVNPPEEGGPSTAVSPSSSSHLVHLEAMPGRCVAGFDGTSTLHDFRGWTKSVQGWVEFEPGHLDRTAKASFVVDARTLDTGDKDRDLAMHEEHLETARYPEMTFRLSEFLPRSGGSCTIKGSLEIHGHRQAVDMTGTFDVRPDGILHVKGQANATMSAFGITPPSKVLVIRTADEIRIWFEVWAAPREGSR